MLLLAAPLFEVSLRAQETSRSTEEIKLDGSGNVGGKSPSPAFTVKDVTVKKRLTVNKQTGSVRQECRFKNDGTTPVKFIFCDMIELNSSFASVPQANNCNIGYDAAARTWRCFAASSTFSHPAGYHFGCVVVDLPAGGMTTMTSTGQSDDFKGKEAKDFQVSYADIFNLQIDGGAGFDAGSCAGCFGRNRGTNFGSPPPGFGPRASATGFWIMSKIPITDPWVRWQSLDGVLHPTQYNPQQAELSLPSEFPAEVSGLGRTVPNTEPALEYEQDLNLWDIFTMSDAPEIVTVVRIDAVVQTNSFEVQIQAIPDTVEIDGGSMRPGRLVISRPPFSVQIPEGASLPFCLGFFDLVTGALLWQQVGTLVQDTVPPIVREHEVLLGGGGEVQVFLSAEDATTSPSTANFWYSIDQGATWGVEPLARVGEPFGEGHAARFGTSFAVEAASNLRYFFNVQDEVFNHVWFGVGSAERVEPAAISITRDGNQILLSWTGGATLEASASVGGSWMPIAGAVNSYSTTADGQVRFFRLRY